MAGGFAAKKLGLLALLPLLIKKGGILIVVVLGLLTRLRGVFRNLFAGRRREQPVPAAAAGAPTASAPTPPFVHPDLAHRQGAVNLGKPGDPVGRHGSGE